MYISMLKYEKLSSPLIWSTDYVCFHEELTKALYKREYLVIIRDNFCYFCVKPYVVTPHLNRLDETVQMRGHNIPFR